MCYSNMTHSRRYNQNHINGWCRDGVVAANSAAAVAFVIPRMFFISHRYTVTTGHRYFTKSNYHSLILCEYLYSVNLAHSTCVGSLKCFGGATQKPNKTKSECIRFAIDCLNCASKISTQPKNYCFTTALLALRFLLCSRSCGLSENERPKCLHNCFTKRSTTHRHLHCNQLIKLIEFECEFRQLFDTNYLLLHFACQLSIIDASEW